MTQQSDLLKLVKSTTLSDLQSMIAARGKLDKLLEKKSALKGNISAIDQEITSIEQSLTRPTSKTKAPSSSRKKSPATKKKKTRTRRAKRGSQPSMQSLIAEILREKNRPLSVNEIADALLNEKSYKTTSKDIKHQLRVMLSLNKKGLFKKLGSGMYGSAERKAPAQDKGVVKTEKAPVRPSKKATPKKTAPKVQAVTKKKATPRNTPPAKPKPVKKALPKKIVQPSIESLIADVLREKKKPMTVYEIAGALLNEKKYQTTSQKFDVQVRILLSKNKKGLFTKLGAGKFGLA